MSGHAFLLSERSRKIVSAVFFVLFIATLPVCGYLLFGFVGLIIGDIQAGALHNEPETGWGFAIAFAIVGPLFALATGASMFCLMMFQKYRHTPSALAQHDAIRPNPAENIAPPQPSDNTIDQPPKI